MSKGNSDLLRAMLDKVSSVMYFRVLQLTEIQKHHYQDLDPAAKRHLGSLPSVSPILQDPGESGST